MIDSAHPWASPFGRAEARPNGILPFCAPGLYLQRIFLMKCVAIAYGQLRKDSLRIKEQVRAQQYS
jgi:hypothetical protein